MLTEARAKRLKPGDKAIADGVARGLYLFPSGTSGSGKWIFRFVSPLTGKRRDMGLGRYPDISIRYARLLAASAHDLLQSGKDPLQERRDAAASEALVFEVPTFEMAARRVHAEISAGFRNAKHANQWIDTLGVHVFPGIGQSRVDTLRAQDFAAVLKPIWLSKP